MYLYLVFIIEVLFFIMLKFLVERILKEKKYIKIIQNIIFYYYNDFNKFYLLFNVLVLDFLFLFIFFVCIEGFGDDIREQDFYGDEQLVDGDERVLDVRGSCFSNVNRYGYRGKFCRILLEEYN